MQTDSSGGFFDLKPANSTTHDRHIGIQFRLGIILILTLLASIVFFSCRENPNYEKRNEADGAIEDPRSLFNNNQIFPSGTRISGVDISGLNIDTARTKLSERIEQLTNAYECRLSCENSEFRLDKNDINLESDLEQVLKAALANGGDHSIEI